MLQIIIEHYKNETISIKKIYDNYGNGYKKLAEIKDNNVIDLDVCIPYINQEIEVYHDHVDDGIKSYTIKAKLEAVEIDPNTQVQCIKYIPLN